MKINTSKRKYIKDPLETGKFYPISLKTLTCFKIKDITLIILSTSFNRFLILKKLTWKLGIKLNVNFK